MRQKKPLFHHVQLRVLQMDTPNAFSKAKVYPNEPPGGMPEKRDDEAAELSAYYKGY
jgi:hypothetical protein